MEEAQTQTQVSKSTFKRKQRKSQQKSHMGNAVHESLSSFNQLRAESAQRRARKQRKEECIRTNQPGDVKNGGEEDGDKEEEVEKKIEALQRIVPGGESLGVDKLFEETAGYIMALQGQLKAMKALASFVEGLEKEKRKFGG